LPVARDRLRPLLLRSGSARQGAHASPAQSDAPILHLTCGALAEAPAAALSLMRAMLPTLVNIVDGWQMPTDTVDVYGNAYLQRALVAMAGLGPPKSRTRSMRSPSPSPSERR
jgi:hypothetical protein